MIKIVFLDAGGTILDPHPSFAGLFANVCRSRGHEVDADDVRRVQENLAPHLIDLVDEDDELEDYAGSSLSSKESKVFWTALYRRFLRELDIEDPGLAGELFATFSRISSYKLYDDVLPVLDQLRRQGYRLGLISNFERWLEEMLIELRVGELFEVSVISGVEGVEKPDAGIYKLALERAGVDPDEAIHVGDSPTLDVEPATSVGIHGVLVDRTGRYPDFNGTRITSLEQLPALAAGL